MGSFGLWHWLIVLGIASIGAAAVGLLVWAILRAVRRPGADGRPPADD